LRRPRGYADTEAEAPWTMRSIDFAGSLT